MCLFTLTNGREKGHEETSLCRTPFFTNDLFTAVDLKVYKDQIFTVNSLSLKCSHVSTSIPHNVASENRNS